MTRALVALLWLAACHGRGRVDLDPSLPDGPAPEIGTMREVVEAATTDEDPALRAEALAWMVRASPTDTRARWIVQGTYDRDPWVQQAVAEAMLERTDDEVMRGFLVEYALRSSGDPYVRWIVVDALARAGHAPALSGLVDAWARQPAWRAGPLALCAWRAGDPRALDVLATVLSTGDVRDDAPFLVGVGLTGHPALIEALARGAARMEDELSLRFSFAQALLGDAGGLARWRAAVGSSDSFEAEEAFELLRWLPPDAREPWARVAARSRTRAVRDAADAMLHPERMVHLAAHPDPWTRRQAVRLAAERPGQEAVARVGLADDDHDVRIAAARLVGRWRLAGLAEQVRPLLTEDAARVRVAGAGALLTLE